MSCLLLAGVGCGSVANTGPDAGDVPDAQGADASAGADAQFDVDATQPDAMVASVCGDGVQAADETCDDGNTEDGDSCSANCSTANCLVPVTYATIQAGIDAGLCAVLHVYSGTYNENVTLSENVSIRGVGAANVIVDGGASGSVFTITASNVSLERLVIRNGSAIRGGGIDNAASLTLTNVRVTANTATAATGAMGGGIYTTGDITLVDSSIDGNTAKNPAVKGPSPGEPSARGGGIFASGAVLDLTNSLVKGNTISLVSADSRGYGGGVAIEDGDLKLAAGSEVSENVIDIDGGSGQGTAAGGGVHATSSSITLEGVSKLSQNKAESSGDGASSSGGAALLSRSSLTVTDSHVDGNSAIATGPGTDSKSSVRAEGGAISATGTTPEVVVTFQTSTLNGNRAEATTADATSSGRASGGALYARSGTSTSTVRVVFNNSGADANVVSSDGFAFGGMFYGNAGTGDAQTLFLATGSTISTNHAESTEAESGLGGAFYLSGGTGDAIATLHLTNSTVTKNMATSATGTGRGGALEGMVSTGRAILRVQFSNATIYDNSATTSNGGLYLRQGGSASAVVAGIRNTILAMNQSPAEPNCSTHASGAETLALNSGGYNLFGAIGACNIIGDTTGNLTDTDPMLNALTDNGGPTQTCSLSVATPAVDAGNPAGCLDETGTAISTDQRGETRTAGGRCDIGAFEYIP